MLASKLIESDFRVMIPVGVEIHLALFVGCCGLLRLTHSEMYFLESPLQHVVEKDIQDIQVQSNDIYKIILGVLKCKEIAFVCVETSLLACIAL